MFFRYICVFDTRKSVIGRNNWTTLKQLGLVTGVKCTNDTSKQIIYIKSKPSTT